MDARGDACALAGAASGAVAAADEDLAALAGRHLAGGTAMDWEYLIITAAKR